MSRQALGRDAILGLQDLPVELLEVPEWGADAVVYVRGLTGHGRAAYFNAIMEIAPDGSTRARPSSVMESNRILAFHGLCDETGARLFNDPEDVEKLGEKNASAIDRVAKAVQRLSGLGAGAVEEAQGNSEPILSDEPSSV